MHDEVRYQLVLVFGCKFSNPLSDFNLLQRHISERLAVRGRYMQQVAVDTQELGQVPKRSTQLTEARWHGRLHLVVVELTCLRLQEPPEVKDPKITPNQLAANTDQGRKLALSLDPLTSPSKRRHCL